MKKTALIAVILVLLFCGCTVQATQNPSLFVERLAENCPEFKLDVDDMFYDQNKCVVFVENTVGGRFAMEMAVDSFDRVQKISLACVETDKADELYCLAKCVAKTYAPQENFSEAAKMIFSNKSYAYYETQWYYYCFSQNESGLYFCIENKQLSTPKEEHLTLKENDLITGER